MQISYFYFHYEIYLKHNSTFSLNYILRQKFDSSLSALFFKTNFIITKM